VDHAVPREHDPGDRSCAFDFTARSDLLGLLARQDGVTALCLDGTITLCELAGEVVELGLRRFVAGDRGSAPIAELSESDRPAALSAVTRARLDGVADAVVRRDGSDEDLILHVVNMLDEWGVLVVVVGGVLRPLLEHGGTRSDRRLPRRLVHHRDRTGHMVWVDDETERLLGWSRSEMLGQSAVQFVDPADHERAIAGWIDMLAGGRIERSRIRYLTSGGDRRWLEVTLTDLLADPRYGYVEVELIDVHDEMMALSAAKFGEAQFDALTESLPVGVIQVGADGEIVYVNRWMRDLTGVTDHQGTARDCIVADDRKTVAQAFDAAVSTGASTNVDVRLLSASGAAIRHCRLRIRSLGLDDDGSSRGAIASIEDVTETLALHARLHTQVRTDTLTGLPNRLALNEWLADHLPDGGDEAVTILYFDLDGFKDVNDRYGHDAGDRLLRAVATAIELAIEPGGLIARIGGDEFVIARPQALDDDQCGELAQQLLDIIDRDVDLDGRTVRVGCSIGVARSAVPHGGSFVLADADLAMYHAKRNGGRRWTVYTGLLRARDGITPTQDSIPADPPESARQWRMPTVTAPVPSATSAGSTVATTW
jgi:diguanylate cyclase (GGDEF)-like protein/PAS domain S-box-containing protein